MSDFLSSNNPAATGVMTLNGLNVATTQDVADLKNLLNMELPDMIMELAYNGGTSSTTDSGGTSGGSGTNIVTNLNTSMAFRVMEDYTATVAALLGGYNMPTANLPAFDNGDGTTTPATVAQLVGAGFLQPTLKLRGNFVQTNIKTGGWSMDELELSLAVSKSLDKTQLPITWSATMRRYVGTDTFPYDYVGTPDSTHYQGGTLGGLGNLLDFISGLALPSAPTKTVGPYTELAAFNTALAAAGFDQIVAGKYWFNKLVALRAWALAGR